jgi:hypothetical protein
VGTPIESPPHYPGHGLDSPTKEAFSPTAHYVRGRCEDRLHRRTAQPIESRTGHRIGQSPEVGDYSADVVALLSLWVGAAYQDVIDKGWFDRISMEQGTSHLSGHLIGAHISEAASVGPREWGAAPIDDYSPHRGSSQGAAITIPGIMSRDHSPRGSCVRVDGPFP